MVEFLKDNLNYIITILAAILGAGALFRYKKTKSKKVVQKNIRTKSGDVVAGDKTTKFK